MATQTIHLTAEECLTDEMTFALRGAKLDENSYRYLVRTDTDVYKPDGSLLLRFRKNVIPYETAKRAYSAARKAAGATDNRGLAAGLLDYHAENKNPKFLRQSPTAYAVIKNDGTLSKKRASAIVKSGIVGYYDRFARQPFCRQTSFNVANHEMFRDDLYPYILAIDRLYAQLVPDAYARQRKLADATSQDFVIRGTAFTTVTVNKNFQTAVHTDQGDYAEGFGNLAVMEAGRYKGGHTVFPKYRVAVDVRSCDFLAMDVHEWHGNTPIIAVSKKYERVSVVCYYRENMHKCGTAEQELERAKIHGAKHLGKHIADQVLPNKQTKQT